MSSGPHVALAVTSLRPRRQAEVTEALAFQATAWATAAAGGLAAPPKLEGECLSAVLIDSSRAFERYIDLAERVWPLPLRAVLVSVGHHVGEAAVPRARAKAVEALAEAGQAGARFRIRFAGREESDCRLAETCATLHAVIAEGWTATRHQAVRAYRELGRQKLVAERLGVTQQAVSQMLLGARMRELGEVESVLRGWLAEPTRPGLWPLRNFTVEAAGLSG